MSEMSKTHEVREILRKQDITSWFQPIVDVETRELLGWEAFSRGPVTGELKTPGSLFNSAAEAGVLKPFDLMCLHNAATCFEQLQLDQKLFVHLSNEMLLASTGRLKDRVGNLIAESAIAPSRMVLEIDERSALCHVDELFEAAASLKQHGFELAIDNPDLSMASHRIWSELQPEFVKIDRRYVRQIHQHPVHQKFVLDLVSHARAIHAKVIAEGVETAEELHALTALGVQAIQGFLIQKPELAPTAPDLSRMGSAQVHDHARSGLGCDLVVNREAVDLNTPVREVLGIFEAKVFVSSIAVLDQERVKGLVHRAPFLAELSRKQRRNVLLDMPISALMEQDFLSVDAFVHVEQISWLITTRARIQSEHDFVITCGDRFLGTSNVIEVLRTITRQKAGASQQADLLTMLPGSIPLGACVDELLDRNEHFTIVLLDLTDFKPYNNHYGHSKGDAILVMLADILRKHISPETGFLGHIGGDDFVVVIRQGDWQKLLTAVLAEFDQRVIETYSDKDRQRGGIESTDRFGEACFFPFLSISGGAFSVTDEYFESFQSLLTTLIQLKQRTKRDSQLRLAHQHRGQISLYSLVDGEMVMLTAD